MPKRDVFVSFAMEDSMLETVRSLAQADDRKPIDYMRLVILKFVKKELAQHEPQS